VTTFRAASELPISIKSAIFTLIRPATREFASGVMDKRDLLRGGEPSDELIVIWTGQYRSDAFAVTVAEARERLK
jgi:hypothetical protein